MEAAKGQYHLSGTLQPQLLVGGLVGRLSDPGVDIDATGTFKKRVIDGKLSLTSPALALTTEGGIDLGHNLFDDLRIEARLLRPEARSGEQTSELQSLMRI